MQGNKVVGCQTDIDGHGGPSGLTWQRGSVPYMGKNNCKIGKRDGTGHMRRA